MTIRKDNKVSTIRNNVKVIGVVTQAIGSQFKIQTNEGDVISVLKTEVTKLNAQQYKIALQIQATIPSVPLLTQLPVLKTASKKQRASTIFNNMVGVKRKEVLVAFQDIGLTSRGASTYYQNFKSGQWS